MKRVLILIFLLWCIILPVSALEIQAPAVPESGKLWMPETVDSFEGGLAELLDRALTYLVPELKNVACISAKIFSIVLLTSILQGMTGSVKSVCGIVEAVGISAVMVGHTGTLLTLGMDTVREITDYGKLLLPVMTAALAAQGGITASASLYMGTAVFNAVLSNVITSVMMPGIRLYLVISIVSSVTGEEFLKRMADFLKSSSSWIMKTMMMVFTTYLGITGVVSGTTDAAALKAAKVTISTVVPVVGSVLSDASEAVLVGAGIIKNAAGIYGILAVLAIFAGPFVRLMAHWVVLKLTGAVCAIFGSKSATSLVDAFSTSMGFLLAVTGGCCLMVLVSTVCFMRGVQ